MKAAVHDANVLIDLLHAGLLEVSSRLGLEFHVAEAVIAEIVSPDQRAAVARAVSLGWLRVDGLGPDDAERVASLQESSRVISFADAASLALARSLGAILLTGDRPLRELAEAGSTETHGVLWLLDRLVQSSVLAPAAAAAALRLMLAAGARLPKPECDSRLRIWSPT